MAAILITDRLSKQRDVNLSSPANLEALVFDAVTGKWINSPTGTAVDQTARNAASAAQLDVDGHEANVANPHVVTKAQVGLGNADNTSDANKPVSSAQATADALVASNAASDATSKANAAQAFAIQRANHTGVQAISTVTNLQGTLDVKADLVGGVVPTAQIPAIAITDYLGSVASQVAMLALTGQKGDWVNRSDLGTSWVISGNDPTQLSSWTQLSYPANSVTSVNGQVGVVVLGYGEVGADAAGAAAAAQEASQPLDNDLTAIAALTTTAFGRSFLDRVDAAAGRTLLNLGTLAIQSGTFSGTSSGTNTGDQDLSSYSSIGLAAGLAIALG